VDWESHFDEQWKAYDEERTSILNWLGLKIIRYTNNEIKNNFDWVCQSILIEMWLKD
jgi:very-short-patch-repair endonuclease